VAKPDVEEFDERLQALEKRHAELHVLFDTIRDVISTLSLREVLSRLLRRVLAHLESEIGSILILRGEELRIAVAEGLPTEVVENACVSIGEGVTGQVAASRQPLLIEDIAGSKFDGQDDERYYTRSLISAPIIYRGRLYGVINVNNKHSHEAYDSEDLELLVHIAAHAAVAVANAHSYEELLDRAEHDSLTGLANHGYFWSAIAREWERADRYQRELSVVMMDLDHFKRSNDVHGHLTGDETLRQMSQILQDGARTADLTARYGGDEFAVILPETSEEGAVAFGEKIRQQVEADRLGPDSHPVTVSIGVATSPGTGTGSDRYASAADLVRAADAELYRAKQGGRNRVCSKNSG
jgi:diguanylate cyclase (GGDEF)-like protein